MSEELFGRVFFIISDADRFAGADLFLSQRGWKVQSGRLIKECISMIASNPPDFVFVSVDHPQLTTTNVPKLIKEALGIPVIGFSELATPESFLALDSMAVEYKMNQKPSGMAFERMILNVRHLFDLRKSRIASEFNKFDENAGADFKIIKGAKREKEKLMKFDGLKPTKEFNITQKGPQADRFKIVQEGAKAEDFEFKQEGPGQGKDLELRSGRDPQKSKKIEMPSILADAVRDSFKMTVAHKDNTEPETINICSTLFALTIQSENFNGILLLAMGKDLEPDGKFISAFSHHLLDYLKQKGEVTKPSQMTLVRINPVAFFDWAEASAEFTIKSIHLSYEIAVAFFPVARERDLTPFEIVDQKEKIRININDLQPNLPVDFDLYIYLSSNDKFLLYTPKNFLLYENQLTRLNDKGVHHLFIDLKQESVLKTYFLQIYLNDLIKEFNSPKKSAA